jgi:TrmH family RNA methyltransferase
MANFGLSRLTVVAPYQAHWREAKSAVGAPDLLKNARETTTLAEAIADSTLVIGTASLTRRNPEQPIVPLPILAPLIRDKEKIALVFGSEKRGLTRDDLAHCHLLVTIPTDPRQPSLNLGQAVAVCLYELARNTQSFSNHQDSGCLRSLVFGDRGDPIADAPPASTRDLDLLTGLIEETMAAANYSPAAMRRANHHDLHLLLRRLALSRSDARRILGLFRRILWRLHRNSGQSNDQSTSVPHK